MGRRDDTVDVVLDDPGDDVTDNAHLLKSVLTWGGVKELLGDDLYGRAWDAVDAQEDEIEEWRVFAARQLEEFTVTTQEYRAENQRLREALKAVLEVAYTADGGDPWYCEHEGVDAKAAYTLAREELAGDAE